VDNHWTDNHQVGNLTKTSKQVIPHIIQDLPPKTFEQPTLNHAQTRGCKIVWQGEHFIDANLKVSKT
jgi:hypothetical protein